ncbi:MAG: extracellular solute-binding protein [Chloroflexi bacterium]|nr:extracellular solute-binding protein [Chloroflexota bacterium]
MRERASITRRGFLQIGLASAGAAALAACAPAPSAPAQPAAEKAAPAPEKAPVTAKLVWYAAQAADHLPPFQEQHAMWKEMQPGVTIEEVFVPWSEYTTKMTTMLAGGETIDVVWTMIYNGAGSSLSSKFWVDRDALLDFTPVFDAGKIKREDYYAGVLDHWLYKDKFWGAPFEAFQMSFWYNTDLFEAGGVGVPTEEWTWEDHREAAAALTTRAADGRPEQFGTMGLPWLTAIYQAGGNPVADDNETLLLDSAESRLGFEEYHYFVANGYAPLGDDTKTFAGLHTGMVALQAHGNYMWTTFRAASADLGFDVRAVTMPKGPGALPAGKAGWVGFNMWSVFSSTKHQDAAIDFAVHLGYGKGAEPWAATGRVSPLKRFDLDYYQEVAGLSGVEKERYATNLNTTFTNLDQGYIHPNQPDEFHVGDLYWGGIGNIYNDELRMATVEKSKTLDEALSAAWERAQQAIKDARSA